MTQRMDLPDAHKSDVVAMALSDDISFADIRREYGLREKDVKALMRETLKSGSYKAWRRRIRAFGERRAHYK